MVAGDDEDSQLTGQHRTDRHIRVGQRQPRQDTVPAAPPQVVKVGVVVLKADTDAGVPVLERLDDLGDVRAALGPDHGGQPQPPGYLAGAPAGTGQDLVQGRQMRGGLGQQPLPGRCQRHPPAGAVEQPDAKAGLQ